MFIKDDLKNLSARLTRAIIESKIFHRDHGEVTVARGLDNGVDILLKFEDYSAVIISIADVSPDNYKGMSVADEDTLLFEIINEVKPEKLLELVPGIYSEVREFYNNEILKRWEVRQETKINELLHLDDTKDE